MTVYFVRHGETFHNRKNIHQPDDAPLSERGRVQAQSVAEALSHLDHPLLISSTLTRAQETAGAIGARLNSTPEFNPLFREMKRPSSVFNRAYYGFYSLRVGLALMLHARNHTWHYEDEENYADIHARVKKAKEHLESLFGAHEHVIIVSHAVFINLFLTNLRCGCISLFRYVLAVLKVLQVGNGSITHLSLDCRDGVYTWSIGETDNRAHLKE